MLRRPTSTMPRKWRSVSYLSYTSVQPHAPPLMSFYLFNRRELMHMLHIRRKAEIEILSSMKIGHPIYNRPLNGQHEDVSNICLDHDFSLGSHHDNSTASASSDHPVASNPPASLASTAFCSSPLTNVLLHASSASPPPASLPTHAPLIRYLINKINGYVVSAQAHANTTDA